MQTMANISVENGQRIRVTIHPEKSLAVALISNKKTNKKINIFLSQRKVNQPLRINYRSSYIQHRRSFCDELCQLYDVIYKTRCPTLIHTKHPQSLFIGNFHIFCLRNENDDGVVVFCSDLSFHWYIGR